MTKKNGDTDLKIEDLNIRQLVELQTEVIQQLVEQVETLNETVGEILEKVNNFNFTPNDGFSYDT